MQAAQTICVKTVYLFRSKFSPLLSSWTQKWGHTDIKKDANRGSDRKWAMTPVGWLDGLLPAKKEKPEGETAKLHPLCVQFLLYIFFNYCQGFIPFVTE